MVLSTQRTQDELKRQRDRKIYELWLACWTQEEIGERVNVDQVTISRIIEDMQNGKIAKMHNSPTFEPELYDVWSFGKATNEVRHPENIHNVYSFSLPPYIYLASTTSTDNVDAPEKKGQGRYTTWPYHNSHFLKILRTPRLRYNIPT